MSWFEAADWADEMSEKLHKERLRVAAKHFDVDIIDILGNEQREMELINRYEAAGLAWPRFDLDKDED